LISLQVALSAAAAVLVFLQAGYLARRPDDRLAIGEWLALSYGLGIGLVTTQMLLFSLGRIRFTAGRIVLPWVVAWVLHLARLRRRHVDGTTTTASAAQPANSGPFRWRLTAAAFVLLTPVILTCSVMLFRATFMPVWVWDSWAIWGSQGARVLSPRQCRAIRFRYVLHPVASRLPGPLSAGRVVPVPRARLVSRDRADHFRLVLPGDSDNLLRRPQALGLKSGDGRRADRGSRVSAERSAVESTLPGRERAGLPARYRLFPRKVFLADRSEALVEVLSSRRLFAALIVYDTRLPDRVEGRVVHGSGSDFTVLCAPHLPARSAAGTPPA